MEYNSNNHKCNSLPLSVIDDVVVANRKITSRTSQNDMIVGTGYSTAFMRGNASTTSVTIGDIMFTQSDKNIVLFDQVQDPDGVASIFKSTRGVIISEQEYNNYVNSNLHDDNRIGKNRELICPICESRNPEDSIFCNKCGSKLSLICLKCGSANATDSAFCNKCGQKLNA